MYDPSVLSENEVLQQKMKRIGVLGFRILESNLIIIMMKLTFMAFKWLATLEFN